MTAPTTIKYQGQRYVLAAAKGGITYVAFSALVKAIVKETNQARKKLIEHETGASLQRRNTLRVDELERIDPQAVKQLYRNYHPDLIPQMATQSEAQALLNADDADWHGAAPWQRTEVTLFLKDGFIWVPKDEDNSGADASERMCRKFTSTTDAAKWLVSRLTKPVAGAWGADLNDD